MPMELKRLRITAALACGGGIIALTTGCNVSGNVSSSSSQSSSPPASSGSASSGGSTGGKGGGTTSVSHSNGDTPRCMAAELHADLQVQNSMSEEKGVGTLILTNRSNHRCLIPAGWAPIGTGRPDYTPLPATRTNYPGSGRNITLGSGRSVFAGMKWHTGPGCGTTSGLGVAWNSSWIPITYLGLNGHRPPICGSLVLGTIQPSMQGVNFT
jgi:hypothetical protein